jgi:hypothetical protein
MAKQGSSIGWKLDRDQRRDLLGRFPPRYAKPVADHVTFLARAGPDALLPPHARARIVGHADDEQGVEAMVVAIEGETDRPDGSTWHITWSLAPGREAKESNDVIAAQGWAAFGEPIPIILTPARWP